MSGRKKGYYEVMGFKFSLLVRAYEQNNFVTDMELVGILSTKGKHEIGALSKWVKENMSSIRKGNEFEIIFDVPVIMCGCGCTGMFYKYDLLNRERKFIPGHNKKSTVRQRRKEKILSAPFL